jgi:hypothetical protein
MGIKSSNRSFKDFSDANVFVGHPRRNVPFAFIDGLKGMQMVEVREMDQSLVRFL